MLWMAAESSETKLSFLKLPDVFQIPTMPHIYFGPRNQQAIDDCSMQIIDDKHGAPVRKNDIRFER